MSSLIAKQKNLRRSRAIKVKSGRLPSQTSESPEDGAGSTAQAIKVADRIKVFEGKEDTQGQGNIKKWDVAGRRVSEKRREDRSGLSAVKCDTKTPKTWDRNVAGKDTVAQEDRMKVWEAVASKEGNKDTFDSHKEVRKNKLAGKLKPRLEEAGKLPPVLSPKPSVNRRPSNQRSPRSNDIEGDGGELNARVEGVVTKGHPPISPKPSLSDTKKGSSPSNSPRHGRVPPTSPKPKLSAGAKSSKLPLGLVGNEELTRTQSTPASQDAVLSMDGLRDRKAKDSGYGSSPSVVSKPHQLLPASVVSNLARAKKAAVCKSIENLADEECTVEEISADVLSQCFDDERLYETVDGQTKTQTAPAPISALYISCMADDDLQSQTLPSDNKEGGRGGRGDGTRCKNVAISDHQRALGTGSGGNYEADSQIYESIRTQEDQDFSDWSDYDDSDEFDDFTEPDDDLESSTEEVDNELLQVRRKKLYCIVEELKDTEVTYVHKLQLLVEAKDCAESNIKVETNSLFPYIDEIYKLHKEDFLPKLKQRIKNWEENKYIGDIMKGFAPFLKIYTDYVKNFDRANDTVETWLVKSPTFKQKIQQICDKYATKHSWVRLDIKAHMLEPIQRVPRYKLLLTDYQKRLPTDTDPKETTNIEGALKLVSEAAQHFELTINQKTEFGELLMLDGLIQSPVPILGSDRKLLKQGPILKYCQRTDKHDPRYIFLFSDILVVCKEYPLKISGPKYKARQVLGVQDMQVLEGSKLDHELTFVVKTKEKIIEFMAETEEDKLGWQQVLWKVIADCDEVANRKNSLQFEVTEPEREEPQQQALGHVAPLWVKNNEVTMCMVCTSDFSTFLRRHHCRACGCVVCSKCSSHTWKLEYANGTDQRVCDSCYQRLTETSQEGPIVTQTIRAASKLKKRFRELCIQWGYVQLSSNEGRSWQKVYCEIHEGGMLYVYKASQNPKPEWNADLGGAEVTTELVNDTIVLRVTLDGGKSHLMKGVFKEQTKEDLWRWGEAFDRAIKDGVVRHSGVEPDNMVPMLDEKSPSNQPGNSRDSESGNVPPLTNISRSADTLEQTISEGSQTVYDDVYETVNCPYTEDPEAEEIYDDVWNDSSFSSEYEEDFDGRIVVNESIC